MLVENVPIITQPYSKPFTHRFLYVNAAGKLLLAAVSLDRRVLLEDFPKHYWGD